MRKLTLDPETLCVASFDTGAMAQAVGTIRAQELLAGVDRVSATNCLTTPCCPRTVVCPTLNSPCTAEV